MTACSFSCKLSISWKYSRVDIYVLQCETKNQYMYQFTVVRMSLFKPSFNGPIITGINWFHYLTVMLTTIWFTLIKCYVTYNFNINIVPNNFDVPINITVTEPTILMDSSAAWIARLAASSASLTAFTILLYTWAAFKGSAASALVFSNSLKQTVYHSNYSMFRLFHRGKKNEPILK